jgi:DNA-directed RNA polymerase subunit alpha
MEELLLPSKIELMPGENDRIATLVVEPCYHGYGTTIGNALRRTLLSSLPGAAVVAVKIKDVQHEFMAMNGVKEDVLEVVLNLKQLRMRLFSDEPVRLKLSAKGDGKVTAKDIEKNSEVEIVNPDLHIATLTDKKSELEMEIFVGKGRGYVPIEERAKDKAELGVIAIDAVYSPVREVGYRVENTRVGQITNFDRLVMNIETDGTITPSEAVDMAVKILLDHFTLLKDRGMGGAAMPEMPAAAEAMPEAGESAAMTDEDDEERKKSKKKASEEEDEDKPKKTKKK